MALKDLVGVALAQILCGSWGMTGEMNGEVGNLEHKGLIKSF